MLCKVFTANVDILKFFFFAIKHASKEAGPATSQLFVFKVTVDLQGCLTENARTRVAFNKTLEKYISL